MVVSDAFVVVSPVELEFEFLFELEEVLGLDGYFPGGVGEIVGEVGLADELWVLIGGDFEVEFEEGVGDVEE